MKEKKVEEKELACPWNQRNGYVCDYTFATRLFSFLMRQYQQMGAAHPMDEEEFQYLVRCAADLKVWQMSVPTELNRNYFNNLRNQLFTQRHVKYLEAINAKNAFDIDRYLAEEPMKEYFSSMNPSSDYSNNKGVYVAVNEDSKFHLFLEKPIRTKKKEYVEDKSVVLEDHYGKEYHPDKWTGNYINYWVCWHNYKEDEGLCIEPERLPACTQSMTWEDEPKKLI